MNTAMIARVLAALRAVKDSPPGQIPRDYWHACTLAHNELEAATHHQVIDKVDAEPTDQFGRTPEMTRFQNDLDAGDDE